MAGPDPARKRTTGRVAGDSVGPMGTGAVPRGGVWYATVAPGARRLFRGRHYDQLVVDDRRVVVTTRRGRIVLETTVDELELARVRSGLLLQVLARDDASRTHVFEFRPRRHAAGRAFADALR
jgi:hypothetical protein